MTRMFSLLLGIAILAAPAVTFAKPAKAPRMSTEEMQTVRSWDRVLGVMEQKMRPGTTVMSADVAARMKTCPAPTKDGVALVGDDRELIEGIATIGFVAFNGLSTQVAQLELAAGRIKSLPVRSAPLRSWQRMQVRDLGDAARLGTMITEPGDPCAFVQLLLDNPPMSAETESRILSMIGVPLAGQPAARDLLNGGDARDGARKRATMAAKAFLTQRGMAKANITRDATIFS